MFPFKKKPEAKTSKDAISYLSLGADDAKDGVNHDNNCPHCGGAIDSHYDGHADSHLSTADKPHEGQMKAPAPKLNIGKNPPNKVDVKTGKGDGKGSGRYTKVK